MQSSRLTIILGALLFLSLTGNLFLGGVMLGKNYGGGDGKRGYDRHAEWKKRDSFLKEKLSEKDRSILKEHMSANRDKFKQLKNKLDDTRDAVESTMRAEPFDQAALDSALRAEKELKAELLTVMREAKQQALEKLSPEGRQTLEKMRAERGGEKMRAERGGEKMRAERGGEGFRRRYGGEDGGDSPFSSPQTPVTGEP